MSKYLFTKIVFNAVEHTILTSMETGICINPYPSSNVSV
jgi:hypothetical protein